MEKSYIGIKEGERKGGVTFNGNKGLIVELKEDGRYYYTNFVGFSKRLTEGFSAEEIEHDLNKGYLAIWNK